MYTSNEITIKANATIPFEHQAIYTVPKLAKLLQVNPQVIRNLIKAGVLKTMKLGQTKITCYEVERFLREADGKDFSDPFNVKTNIN